MGRKDYIGPRLLRCGLALAALMVAVSCGGDSNSNGDSNNTNDLPQVRTGTRLGWSQAASSLQQLSAMTFRLYVSGTAASLGGAKCSDTPNAGAYDCSGTLPSMSAGVHDLELTSTVQGVESPRSPSLRVNFVASTVAATPPVGDAQSASGVDGLACTVSHRLCFAPTALVARDLVDPTSLTAAPDGRLFFVELGTKIRVVASQVLVQEPALTAPSSTRIVGMAVDSDFNQSHIVYVASSDQTRGKAVTLSITRYREVANTLGEGATIVTGLPFAPDALAPLAVDASGLLYIAMPSVKADDESGTVLRLTRDGQVPRDNAQASPIVAFGYNRPTGLAIDSAEGQIWLSGHSARWMHGMSTFSVKSDQGATWPRVPHTLGTWVQGQRFHAATIGLTRRQGETARLLITAGRQLYDGSIGEGGRLNSLSEVVFKRDLPIEASASTPGGLLFLIVRDAAGTTSIVQMQLQQ